MAYEVVMGGLLTAFVFCLVIFAVKRREHQRMQRINGALEELLHKKDISYSDIEDSSESETMALVRRVAKMVHAETVQSAEENEAVKAFIANISHQLKTPLSNISLYAEILEGEGPKGDEQKNFIKKIRQEASKLEWLLRNLFKVSRLESGAIEFEGTEEYIKKTITMSVSAVYSKVTEKNIRVSIEPFQDMQLFHNRKWTIEALGNVLENAVKYSEPDSEIKIFMEKLETYTVIHIKDEGIGIPKEEMQSVFGRFYRGTNVRDKEGAGIGLYLTRLILMKEHGNITVTANKGPGCCFRIFLQNCKNSD